MATRFVRIDLSDMARDFRPIALEPGVPLVDRSGASDQILFRWLGGMAAEPEYEGESVNYYVRNDHGGRLEEVSVQPATAADLNGMLKHEVESLKDRVAKAKSDNPVERMVHKTIARMLNDLLGEAAVREDLDNYFFRYKDANGKWRLVWCWGYQRIDEQPAPSIICGDEQCGLLFVRRPGKSAKCPSCEALTVPKKKKKRPGRKRLLVLALLLFIAAMGYWLYNRNRLVATPGDWSGPAGSRVAYRVTTPGFFGFFSEDVTSRATALVADPRIGQIDPASQSATARSTGKTEVRFYLGERIGKARLTVTPPEPPDEIAIVPAEVALAVGGTARLTLIGRYEDGREVDLTDSAEWLPKNDGLVYAHEGFLQGLAEGTSTVGVRYRAGPTFDYQEASASVDVTAVTFAGLELALDGSNVATGRSVQVRAEAIGEDGTRYSVADSSRLKILVDPPHLASTRGCRLVGKHAGTGRLEGTLDGLTGGCDFRVTRPGGPSDLVVAPERVELLVGEVLTVQTLSSGHGGPSMSSSTPSIVQVGSTGQLIARSEGAAQIEVRQSGQTKRIDVTVVPGEVEAITVEPGYVGVPVDHATRLRVWGHLADGRAAELSRDLVMVEAKPSARNVDFRTRALTLAGVLPTERGSPQGLSLRFNALKVDAPVEVIRAPFRLELTPSGPIDLPLGQAMRPDSRATYPAGHAVQVPSENVQLRSEPVEGVEGLAIRGDRVAATAADVGPIEVWGTYQGETSNRVEFRAVEAEDVLLVAEPDRTLRVVGESGRIVLSGRGPNGDAELVDGLGTFSSSNSEVVEVDRSSGAFAFKGPGVATITAEHAASKKPISIEYRSVDPANAQLVLEPSSATMAVDERTRFELILEGEQDGEVHRQRVDGPEASYHLDRIDALRWQTPLAVALKPTEPGTPIELTASLLPHLTRPARTRIEVVDIEAPAALRIVPSEASLAVGQSVALSVEAQWSEGDAWKEIRPDAILWHVPGELVWSEPTQSLRALATMPEGTDGAVDATATYRGLEATATIQAVEPTLDPTDPSVTLVLHREPEGRFLPVGTQQRYTIMLQKGDQRESAADVQWPETFGNRSVHFDAPVLTAKRGGHQQWLSAEVGGRKVRFRTVTVDPFRSQAAPPRGEDSPVSVAIISDQGDSVRFAKGAEFNDFRVEALYDDGFTEDVTQKATMHCDGSLLDRPVGFRNGRMVGLRPGEAMVHVDFAGVSSQKGLHATVTKDVEIDELVLTPVPMEMLPGETHPMEAEGRNGGKSTGILTGFGNMTWQSDNPTTATVQGGHVSGKSLGSANVTAAIAGVQSHPAEVRVVDSIADGLIVDQDLVQLRVGESARLGSDFSIFRGDLDLSQQVRVSSSVPDIVRWDPETQSLVGVSPGGPVPVSFTAGDKIAHTQVEVITGGLLEGDVIVESAFNTLADGQAAELRVYLLTPDGDRIDRTASAMFTSSDPQTVQIRGNLACGLVPGTADITASLAESDTSGHATVEVIDEEILELIVEPASTAISVGDTQPVRVLGRAASGTHLLFQQPRLKMTRGGQTPEAIQVLGSEAVEGMAVGNATLGVDWEDRLHGEVPVTVGQGLLADLMIEPLEATIRPAEAQGYQVTCLKDGQRRVLEPEHGVRLITSDPGVAVSTEGSTFVAAIEPGRTTVTAEYGDQRAEAVLNVSDSDLPLIEDVAINDPAVHVGPDGEVILGDVIGGIEGVDFMTRGSRTAYVGPRGIRYNRRRVVAFDPYGRLIRQPNVVYPPVGEITDLRFIPGEYHISRNSPGVQPRVYEVLPNGLTGREVTGHPALEIIDSLDVVKVEREASGIHRLRPNRMGQTRVSARLGLATSSPALNVRVGPDVSVNLARLAINPSRLDLWPGEVASLRQVTVIPGRGGSPIPVDYQIVPPAGQDVVLSEGNRQLRGNSPGSTTVAVRAVAPGTPYDGLSGTTLVRVMIPGKLRIEPDEVSLRPGETTPSFTVLATDASGRTYPVAAVLESVDPSVLELESMGAGRFVARSAGSTQVRAVHRNRDVYADVQVRSRRFEEVQADLNEAADEFTVKYEVLAARTEGPLEYRVYVKGQTPPESWTSATESGEHRRAVLESPSMPYARQRDAHYGMMLEARSTEDGTVERYPFTFRLAPRIMAH